ncbi:1282_t:CDS:2 [Cetraspora pellucida]|uniref:1282_t:CDS:1 n=1 Tax=Cetraspora pellucida TaxID=1433469 RepID=A0A9N9CA03_9GLOM|nr:1282_t:CDS:2 [Cetraspora pellucida]
MSLSIDRHVGLVPMPAQAILKYVVNKFEEAIAIQYPAKQSIFWTLYEEEVELTNEDFEERLNDADVINISANNSSVNKNFSTN